MKKLFSIGALLSLLMLLSLAGCGGGGSGDGGGISADATGGLGTAPSPTDSNGGSGANQSPSLAAIGAKTIGEGETLSFTVSGTDPDGNTLTYSASNLPLGATFDAAAKTFTWTPVFGQAGVYPNVLFQVTDSGTPPASASEAVTITVGQVNRPPVLAAIGDKQVNEGQTLTFTISGTDPDGNAVAYQSGNLPQGSSFDPATGVFTWTPTLEQAGNYTDVRFTAVDNGTPPQSDTETITITVGNVNRPPVLAPIGDKQVDEGALLQFVVTGTDPDGDALVFSADNLPAGATFDQTTQTFSWTPNYENAACNPFSVVFKVQDTGSPVEVDMETITITVGDVNRAPQFTPVGILNPPANSLLQFFVTATDPDGNAVAYTTSSLPAGASFNPATQQFSWVTPAIDSYWYVTFYATDNGLPPMKASLQVLIKVGSAPNPATLIDYILQTVMSLNLDKNIENSYMANLKDAQKFFYDNKNTYAVNQLQAFINKVNVDAADGLIGPDTAATLTGLAQNAVDMVPQHQ